MVVKMTGPSNPTPTVGMGYKEKVTDEQLVNLIESGVQNSVGDWLNSSDLTRERLRSTYEYAGVPQGHLAPQGVSQIVDTSTTEVIEAYTAVICDLFLSNQKLARFVPINATPEALKAAKDAATITNYAIFKQNKGWEILQTWVKSALLWKNGLVRWDYIEDYEYKMEEFERISSARLDTLLSEDGVELIGSLNYDTEIAPDSVDIDVEYVDVRIRRTIDKSRVKIENVPPESFRISRDASCIEDATFVGVQVEMTRSEIRKYWPDIADTLSADDWDGLGDDDQWLGNARYSEDIAARKFVTGQEYWQGSVSHDLYPVEANRPVVITECWMHVDRDGDGIAELKHFIIAGRNVLHEEDVDMVPLASISPVDIPFEFYGLSMADFTRSTTMASTAILRGFVENVYLTNYSPKLADPELVDFSALQNMKPKQIVSVKGPANLAVQNMPPQDISSGTMNLMQHLQTLKEQATGMSKAAQGLNDELYVSGNSEAKLSAVQSASQKRIQHIARRFAETGFKRLIAGVYASMRTCLNTKINLYEEGEFKSIDPTMLPSSMDCDIFLDIGENSNQNRIRKLSEVATTVLPGLVNGGAQTAIRPEAAAALAGELIEAMGLDSNNYMVDYTSQEFKEKSAQAAQTNSEEAMAAKQMEIDRAQADMALVQGNVSFVGAQANNTKDDNARQLAVSIDKHFQEWAKLHMEAKEKGIELPSRPDFSQILTMAESVLKPNGE